MKMVQTIKEQMALSLFFYQ